MANTETCLVTGGAGFIGSHLCDTLLTLGYRVICLDNLITGLERNLVISKRHRSFRFVRRNITESLLKFDRIAYIFHLASPASVVDYQKYPEETARVNSVGTMNMLSYAVSHRARFLLASTSEVYGAPKEHPQKETYWGNVNPIGIRACYDESKRFAEMITMVYARKYSLDVRVVRIFNTYGPRMRKNDGRVVSNFINQALENRSLTVYGNGMQTRSFCYVSDLVDGITKAMVTPKTKGQVLNLGNPEEYRVIDLAHKVKSLTQARSDIIHTKLPEDDPEIRRPDITKAKKLLGWEPKVDLDTGLSETIAYYQNIR